MQLAAQVWLQTQGKMERYKDQFLLSLDKAFPNLPNFVNQNKCESFFPRLESDIQQEPRPDSKNQLKYRQTFSVEARYMPSTKVTSET